MKKIIIIEDDLQLIGIYKHEFQKQGFQVIHSETGFDILDLIQKNQPDAILLDLLVPGIKGLELLAQLKKADLIDKYPVITYSALATKMVAEKSKKLGAKLHIGKSDYTSQEIVQKVLGVIKRK
ncbi:MAG: response regulator [Patescibacteria group bacterium]